jgi:hypothetical protein
MNKTFLPLSICNFPLQNLNSNSPATLNAWTAESSVLFDVEGGVGLEDNLLQLLGQF